MKKLDAVNTKPTSAVGYTATGIAFLLLIYRVFFLSFDIEQKKRKDIEINLVYKIMSLSKFYDRTIQL